MSVSGENVHSQESKPLFLKEDFVSQINRSIPGFVQAFFGNCQEDTKARAISAEIYRVAMGSTSEKTRSFMNMIDQEYRNFILALLKTLQDAENIEDALTQKIRQFEQNTPNHILVPSATGLKAAEGRISAKQCLTFQEAMIREYLTFLKSNNCLSPEVNIAVDPTYFRKVTKRLPRYTKYIVKGQKITRVKGIRIDDIYDTTHGLNLAFFLGVNRKVNTQRIKMPSWIMTFEMILRIYAEFNVKVVIVFADREFYRGYEFGAFSSGNICNTSGDCQPVRLITPTKFFKKNPKKTLAVLDVPDWHVSKINLFHSRIKSRPALMKYLSDYYRPERHGNVHVPILQFAFFEEDESLLPVSESPLHKTVLKYAKIIQEQEERITQNYHAYQALIRAGTVAKRTQNKWLYSRKELRQFKSEPDQMYVLWRQAMFCKAKCEQYHEKLRKLQKKLRFYSVSLTAKEQEIISQGRGSEREALFYSLRQACYEYHQRWGIENYFAFIKRDILQMNKTRSVNWMRVQWLHAQLIYNGYILSRTMVISQKKRQTIPEWKPEEGDPRTRRKPLSTQDYRLLSFNQYICTIAAQCLRYRLETVYGGV